MFKRGFALQNLNENGLKRLLVAYKDSTVGRGVISYENGKITRMLTVTNNPKLTITKEIDYNQFLNILKRIQSGIYTVQTVFIFNDEVERNADSVRKEVVCQ